MNKIKSSKGQALVLIALAVVGLVGFSALAIDGGRIFSDRRHAQNAADTAAFAAALAKIRTPGEEAAKNAAAALAAEERADSNGYNNDENPDTVRVLIPPEDGNFAGNPEYIQVKIESEVRTTFARVLGREIVTNRVEAVARAQGTTALPSIAGAALAAYKQDGTPFEGLGSGTLDVIGSGIFSNSNTAASNCPNGAMKLGGAIDYHVDTGYSSPGGICTVGGPLNEYEGDFLTVPQVPIPTYDIPVPSFTCPATPGVLVGTEYQPGTYNALNPSPGDYSFAAGSYCFTGNVIFNGGNVTASGVNFRFTSGAGFETKGNGTFTCSNAIFHSVGGSGIKFGGNSVSKCSGITFYMESGGVEWDGNVGNEFYAPTSGNYAGLLVYLPAGNGSTIKINGNSGNKFTGSIIALSSLVTLAGNNNTDGLHTQIIANEIKFNGNGTTKIHYNPNEQYNPPASPSIELAE